MIQDLQENLWKYVLLAVFFAGLIVGFGKIPQYEEITVTSKSKGNNAMRCEKKGYSTECAPTDFFRINGASASEMQYSELEIGKTYKCQKYLASKWENCEEVKHD